ncbi:MAG: caspase family protein, partial [Syntrophus sp. (in: bacteria)]
YNTTAPKLNGAPLKLKQYETSRSLAVAPDGQTFLLGTEWSLRLFNARGEEIWQSPVSDVVWAVNITGDGRFALAAFGDGTIRWHNMADGKEVLAFFPHNDRKRWVVWTPEGFFDASAGGAGLIGYHLNRGKDKEARFVGVDKLYDQFYRPDLVMAKFQGKDITEYAKAVNVNRILTMETLPPVVRLTTTSGTRQKREVAIEGEVCDQGGGIGEATLFLNDMPVVVDTEGRGLKIVANGGGEGASCRIFSHTVTLTEGGNVIALMAMNYANTIESNRPHVTLAFHSGQKERSDLYVLAVAVNKYRDGDLRLKYPIPDADDLIKSIQGSGNRLFGKVIVKTVYDDEATRSGLEQAFREMGRETKREDVFILFLAGHGITYERDGNYYFLPVDFRFTGEDAIQKQGVSKDDLMRNLTHIQAMKSLLLLDTCNSGSFAEAVVSRNIVEKTAVARLSRAVGRSTISASSRDQVALEGYEGHGVFTWTILQALAGQAYDKDGKVTVSGLAAYVEETLPKITYKKWGYEQIPQKSLMGMDFPLVLK